MTFTEWLVYAYKEHHGVDSNRYRFGQRFFNCLADKRPDLSEQIRGTDLDPFYQDDRVKKFLDWVERNWDKS